MRPRPVHPAGCLLRFFAFISLAAGGSNKKTCDGEEANGQGKSKKAPKKKPAKKPRVAGRPALKKGPFAASVPPAKRAPAVSLRKSRGIAPAGGTAKGAPQRAATGRSPYDTDLDKNPANFLALTPLSFLERAAEGLSGSHRDHSRQDAPELRAVL